MSGQLPPTDGVDGSSLLQKQLEAAQAQIQALARRLRDLEARCSVPGGRASFMNRHESLNLRRPSSMANLDGSHAGSLVPGVLSEAPPGSRSRAAEAPGIHSDIITPPDASPVHSRQGDSASLAAAEATERQSSGELARQDPDAAPLLSEGSRAMESAGRDGDGLPAPSRAGQGPGRREEHAGERPTKRSEDASPATPSAPLPPPSPSPTPPRAEVSMAATRVVMTQLVSPADSIGTGICAGGVVLSWIDIAAGLAAKSLARRPVVTASVDAVHFLQPCHVHAVVTVAAMVNRVFSTSMEVGVRVEEEDVASGRRHHCCSAYLTFVALSAVAASGEPSPRARLPVVIPRSDYYALIWEEAAARRAARLAARQALRADPERAEAEAACRLLPFAHRGEGATLVPPLETLTGGGKLAEELAASRRASEHRPETPSARSPPAPSLAPCPQRRVIAPALTAAHMTQLILPQHANSIGITFGGWVMRWMEQCAWIAASRVARGAYLLTASLDTLAFLSPTRVGDILYVEAQATAIFGSSAELLISVWAETPEEGGLFECGDAYATVVSMNDQGQPLDIPFELAPQTPQDHVRYRGALERRNARLAMRADLLAVQKRRPALDGVSERAADDDSAMYRALSNARGH